MSLKLLPDPPSALPALSEQDQEITDYLTDAMLTQCNLLRSLQGAPDVVPLSVYETDHDLHTLRPEDKGQWTAATHRAAMEHIAAALRRAGFPAKLVTLNAAKYLRWLSREGRQNSPENRAAFVSLSP